MKSKNNWKKLNEVVLRVDNVELGYEKKISLTLNCGFENISKGRCILKVNPKLKVDGNVGEWEYINNEKIEYSDKKGKWGDIINKILKFISEEETGENESENWNIMMEKIST